MADPRAKIGSLIPIESDNSVLDIPIFEGDNVVGRENLPFLDKRVSRKHIRLHASDDGFAQLIVEGLNPVIVKTGDERKKLCSGDRAVLTHGDVIELIPGYHLLKYVRSVGDRTLASETIGGMSSKERRHSEENVVAVKRSRQILEDETFARSLQEAWGISSYGHDNSVETTTHVSRPESAAVLGSSEAREASNNFSVPKDRLSYIFRLMRVQGVPAPANSSSVAIHDVIEWPEFKANIPMMGNVIINAAFFRKFDYRSAAVRLIASVPGYHVGPNLKKWGHMKLRTLLEECIFDKEFCMSPLIYQFSSLGSLDDKGLAELALSMSSGVTNDKSPLGIGKPLIIWPTVEDVRCSLEGYAAGNALPSPQKNVEREFLKKYWARWKADHVSRWMDDIAIDPSQASSKQPKHIWTAKEDEVLVESLL